MTTLWRCPRCRHESQQPDHVTGMTHVCQPPGRIAKSVEYVRAECAHKWRYDDRRDWFYCIRCRAIEDAD